MRPARSGWPTTTRVGLRNGTGSVRPSRRMSGRWLRRLRRSRPTPPGQTDAGRCSKLMLQPATNVVECGRVIGTVIPASAAAGCKNIPQQHPSGDRHGLALWTIPRKHCATPVHVVDAAHGWGTLGPELATPATSAPRQRVEGAERVGCGESGLGPCPEAWPDRRARGRGPAVDFVFRSPRSFATFRAPATEMAIRAGSVL